MSNLVLNWGEYWLNTIEVAVEYMNIIRLVASKLQHIRGDYQQLLVNREILLAISVKLIRNLAKRTISLITPN